MHLQAVKLLAHNTHPEAKLWILIYVPLEVEWSALNYTVCADSLIPYIITSDYLHLLARLAYLFSITTAYAQTV